MCRIAAPTGVRRIHLTVKTLSLVQRTRASTPTRTSTRDGVGVDRSRGPRRRGDDRREVILPRGNQREVEEDLGEELRHAVEVHYVTRVDELLALALEPSSSSAAPVGPGVLSRRTGVESVRVTSDTTPGLVAVPRRAGARVRPRRLPP